MIATTAIGEQEQERLEQGFHFKNCGCGRSCRYGEFFRRVARREREQSDIREVSTVVDAFQMVRSVVEIPVMYEFMQHNGFGSVVSVDETCYQPVASFSSHRVVTNMLLLCSDQAGPITQLSVLAVLTERMQTGREVSIIYHIIATKSVRVGEQDAASYSMGGADVSEVVSSMLTLEQSE